MSYKKDEVREQCEELIYGINEALECRIKVDGVWSACSRKEYLEAVKENKIEAMCGFIPAIQEGADGAILFDKLDESAVFVLGITENPKTLNVKAELVPRECFMHRLMSVILMDLPELEIEEDGSESEV